MTSELFGQWIHEAPPSDFTPLRRDSEMRYRALRCPCGAKSFRIAGWPTAARGSGSFFWRTLTRLFRETRDASQAGEPASSPFELPLSLFCVECEREGDLFSNVDWSLLEVPTLDAEPREAFRCRVCRRAEAELVVGIARRGVLAEGDAVEEPFPSELEGAAAEVVTRCRSCLREARLASCDRRPSLQEARLDALYGRR